MAPSSSCPCCGSAAGSSLSLPACPFLLPHMSELKLPPTPHARRAPQPPPGPGRLRSCGLVTNCSTLRAGQPGHAGCGFGSQVAVGARAARGCPCPQSRGGAGRRRMQLEWPPGRTEVLMRVRCCCRPAPCLEAALPPLGKGLCRGAGGGSGPHLVCGTALSPCHRAPS